MKVGIIGTGYVGLPTGVGLAELGNKVVCIDREPKKIEALQAGKLTLYEDGLEELFQKNVKAGRIKFTTSMKEGVSDADVVLIAVGTPPHPVTKEADMKYIHAAATELAEYLTGYTVVATKSTVPVGTGDDVEALIAKKNPFADFDVISLPEFLREGFAVHDFFNPDRIVVGANTERARNVIKELYKPFAGKTNMLFVKRRSSETIKYASNAFLAMKIHYINEMADFCEKTGADISEVAQGMGLDNRIGNRFLNAGPGYGGSCFPKDTMAMAYMARQNNVKMTLINAAIAGNVKRKQRMAERIWNEVKDLKNSKIAVLGLAFKNGTDDCRESPALEIVGNLLEKNTDIMAYDPKAMGTACRLLGDKIGYADDMYSCLKGADVLAVLTEWNEFKTLDLNLAADLMRHKNIVDCRNLLNAEQALALGFKYQGIGKKFEKLAKPLKKAA
ncbi:MAG: UDP-glucose/GDP-mannose dehydrogenase family protein [Alphaproteobacteria bacterium]|nr:UDP-glucose/GDP-mannose dehydrogenase family protein [Alphaproteobacteria bacterium]